MITFVIKRISNVPLYIHPTGEHATLFPGPGSASGIGDGGGGGGDEAVKAKEGGGGGGGRKGRAPQVDRRASPLNT